MATLQGKLIKWLKPERNYVNPVNGVDYSIIDSINCPVILGSPIGELSDNQEWLANFTMPSSSYDQRIWLQLVSQRPTNIPHPQYPMYNQYQTSFSLQKRPNSEIIAAIIAKREDANLRLQNEAGGAIFMATAMNAIDDKQNGATLSTDQLECIDRLKEVTAKMKNNVEHSNNLIAVLEAGGEPDLDAVKTDACEFGWEYDRLTPCGFPLQ